MKRDRQTERADQKKQEQLERKRQQEFERQRDEERRKLARQQKLALESQEELRHQQREQSRLLAAAHWEQEKRARESQEHSRAQHRAELLAQEKSEAIVAQHEIKKRDEQQQKRNRQASTARSESSRLKRAGRRPSGAPSKRERIEERQKEASANMAESRRLALQVPKPREKPRETNVSTAGRRERVVEAVGKRERIEARRKEARIRPTERSHTTERGARAIGEHEQIESRRTVERVRRPREKPRETTGSTVSQRERMVKAAGKRERIEERRKEARIGPSQRSHTTERVRQPVAQREQRARAPNEREWIEERQKEARARMAESHRTVERARQLQESRRQVGTTELSKQRTRSTGERRRAEEHQREAHVRVTGSPLTTEQIRKPRESSRLTSPNRLRKKQPRVAGAREQSEERQKEARTRAIESRRAMRQVQGTQERKPRPINAEQHEPPPRVADGSTTESRRPLERARQSQESRRQIKRHDEQRLRRAQTSRLQQREERNRLKQQQLSTPSPISSRTSLPGIPVGNPSSSAAPVGDPPPLLTARIPSGNLSNGLVWLKSSRNRIVSAETGRKVLLRGVNRSGLEYSEPILSSSNPFTDAAGISQAEIQEIVIVWGANIIRLPFNQDWVLNGRGGLSAEVYLEALDQVIYWASSYGAYTLLDLQWIDSSQQNAPLPNRDSITIWKTLAKRYQFEPAVLYDIFNEPHDPQPGDEPLEGVNDDGTFFPLSPGAPVTMNEWQPWARQLIRAIRRIHTDALVFVSGIDWAYDLRGMPLTIVPRGPKVFANLVYCTHVYPQKGPPSLPQGEETLPGRPRSPSWYQAFGYLTRLVPVFATEWGVEGNHEEDPDMLWADTLGQYLSSLRIGWTAWSWSDTPHLVRQYPRPYQTIFSLPHEPTRYGDVVRDRLARP